MSFYFETWIYGVSDIFQGWILHHSQIHMILISHANDHTPFAVLVLVGPINDAHRMSVLSLNRQQVHVELQDRCQASAVGYRCKQNPLKHACMEEDTCWHRVAFIAMST